MLQNNVLSQDLSGLLNIILTDASNLAQSIPDPLAQLGAIVPLIRLWDVEWDVPESALNYFYEISGVGTYKFIFTILGIPCGPVL